MRPWPLALLLVACGSSTSSAPDRPARPAGRAADVVVVLEGVAAADAAPALAALRESLPPGSRVEQVTGAGDLGASLDQAAAILKGSTAETRAIIAIGGGDSAALAGRIARLRRDGVLGYAVHYGAGAGLEAIGYTLTRRAGDPDGLRGAVGAIGAALGSR